jgi:hypothetical protein
MGFLGLHADHDLAGHRAVLGFPAPGLDLSVIPAPEGVIDAAGLAI